MRSSRHSPAPIFVSAFALLAGCGGASVHTVDAASAEAGFCGTHANPGILQLDGRTPPIGGTVNNHDIVHGFTVIDAPAEFRNFELRFGLAHTAGRPSPEIPRFTLVTLETGSIVYQLTIASWSISPGHVELVASAGYDTSAGCTWQFPSPLFSYEIVGGPDGGAPPEPPARTDGGLSFDTAIDVALPPIDAPLDGGVSLSVDAAVEGRPLDVPAGSDTGEGETYPGTDRPLAVDSGIGQ